MPDNARISAVFLGIASGDAHPSVSVLIETAKYKSGSPYYMLAEIDFPRMFSDLLRIAGRPGFDALKNAHVRIDYTDTPERRLIDFRIGHIINEDWMDFGDYRINQK